MLATLQHFYMFHPAWLFFVTSTSANRKLVVWVGGLDSWDPLMKGDCYLEAPRFESQNNNPNQQSKPPIYINLHQFTIS